MMINSWWYKKIIFVQILILQELSLAGGSLRFNYQDTIEDNSYDKEEPSVKKTNRFLVSESVKEKGLDNPRIFIRAFYALTAMVK